MSRHLIGWTTTTNRPGNSFRTRLLRRFGVWLGGQGSVFSGSPVRKNVSFRSEVNIMTVRTSPHGGLLGGAGLNTGAPAFEFWALSVAASYP